MASKDSCPPMMDIRTHGLLKAIGSITNLTVWEALRRCGRASTAQAITLQVGKTLQQVEESLSALRTVDLVSLIPASRAKRVPTWNVTRNSIVVAYTPYDPIDESLMASFTELFGEGRLNEIRRLTKPLQERVPTDVRHTSLHAGFFDAVDLRELWALLQQFERFYERCNEKAGALQSALIRTGAQPTPQYCNYHVSIQMDPLSQGVMALPALQMIGKQVATNVSKKASAGAANILSRREGTVATRLAHGDTRAEIAKSLGISQHTVAEFTRRIYRKLGVNRIAQLAAKMSEMK
jgi:DNA-binding CsgD family transcriptional regulator